MIVYNVLNIYGHLPYVLPSNNGLPLKIVTFGKQESFVTHVLNVSTKIQILIILRSSALGIIYATIS